MKVAWVLLLVFGVVILVLTLADRPFARITEDELSRCPDDSDCIYVAYEHCCTSVRAINREGRSEYDARPQWQGVDLASCVDIPSGRVSFEDIDLESARCLLDHDGIAGNNRCY